MDSPECNCNNSPEVSDAHISEMILRILVLRTADNNSIALDSIKSPTKIAILLLQTS